MPDEILFYGTLRTGGVLTGSPAAIATLGAFRSQLTSAGMITLSNVALYDLGPCPVAQLDRPGATTLAECFAFSDAALLDRLDDYEGMLYQRVRIFPDNRPAWIYVFADPTWAESAPLISHGDWLRHLRERAA